MGRHHSSAIRDALHSTLARQLVVSNGIEELRRKKGTTALDTVRAAPTFSTVGLFSGPLALDWLHGDPKPSSNKLRLGHFMV